MSSTLPNPEQCCSNDCDDPLTTSVQGPKGDAGADGSDGSDGQNAFTNTTSDFTMPAEGSDVTVDVGNSDWASATQVVYVQNAGYMEVRGKPSSTQIDLRNLEDNSNGEYTGNVAPGTTVASGSNVQPGGLQGPAGSDGTTDLDGSSPTDSKGDLLIDDGANNPDASLQAFDPGSGNDESVFVRDSAQTLGWKVAALNLDNSNAVQNTLGISNGGTNASTASGARTNLGLGDLATQDSVDLSSSGDVSNTLGVSNGGTGGSSASAARSNLGFNATPVEYIEIRDEKASGTNGGQFSTGSYQTRDLNTEVVDTGNHASLSSNQLTLDAGTYQIQAWATVHETDSHKLKLRNTSDASDTLLGMTCESPTGSGNDRAVLAGRFTIASSKTFELQHRIETSAGTDIDGGEAASFGDTETYTVIQLWKEG